jgi:threonine dehydrogenase-like Zn-dependent dehydrogenase
MIEPDEVTVAIEAAAYGVRDRATAKRDGVAPGGGGIGTVVSAGIAAGEWLERRVVVARLGPCGECRFCRRGALAGCPDRRELGVDRPGTLGGEVTVRARWLAPADGELEVAAPAAAILGDDALVAYHLYCQIGVAAGEPVVCVGAGPRTALVAQIARAKGARVAEVAEINADTLASESDFADRPWRIFALDGGHLEAAPAGSSIALGDGATVDLVRSTAAGVTIAGAEHGHPDLLPELVALAARGAIDLDAVVEVVDGDLAGLGVGVDDLFRRGKIAVSSSPTG